MALVTIGIKHQEVIEQLSNMVSPHQSAYDQAALQIAIEILAGRKKIDQAYLVKFGFED